MKETISAFLEESVAVKQRMLSDSSLMESIESAARMLLHTVEAGGTIYICGNGGSACDSMHFCEELVARYKRERQGIRAMHFIDGSAMTCWGNDYTFDSVFERYAETFCRDNDCLVGLSTSGNSENVSLAMEVAKRKRAKTIGLLGKGGGAIAALADQAIVIPSEETDRIQEAHITVIHIFCELLETNI